MLVGEALWAELGFEFSKLGIYNLLGCALDTQLRLCFFCARFSYLFISWCETGRLSSFYCVSFIISATPRGENDARLMLGWTPRRLAEDCGPPSLRTLGCFAG
jgi:hypothetical protein